MFKGEMHFMSLCSKHKFTLSRSYTVSSFSRTHALHASTLGAVLWLLEYAFGHAAQLSPRPHQKRRRAAQQTPSIAEKVPPTI